MSPLRNAQGCITTGAPVGTIFTVLFAVFDRSSPALNTTVLRTVTIDDACPDNGYYCAEDKVCSVVDCDTRAQLLSADPPDVDKPTFSLAQPSAADAVLGDEQDITVIYGQARDISLVPCASNLDTADCWCAELPSGKAFLGCRCMGGLLRRAWHPKCPPLRLLRTLSCKNQEHTIRTQFVLF